MSYLRTVCCTSKATDLKDRDLVLPKRISDVLIRSIETTDTKHNMRPLHYATGKGKPNVDLFWKIVPLANGTIFQLVRNRAYAKCGGLDNG